MAWPLFKWGNGERLRNSWSWTPSEIGLIADLYPEFNDFCRRDFRIGNSLMGQKKWQAFCLLAWQVEATLISSGKPSIALHHSHSLLPIHSRWRRLRQLKSLEKGSDQAFELF
jgi:hypothetical protein